ncbi:MAG: phosphoglycolate phosphatase [Verrucomicrobia bacterium]|jgi:phosphoglycolate phosphatase|nr:phosphoglycolate phosphatase [Verrucomicrobiota bacterium]MBT6097831.1 phosphoglycolate phosphatase [Marinovum sp.]MBT6526800.1 phosphoglycolate phosphatase [Marinovum sp.]
MSNCVTSAIVFDLDGTLVDSAPDLHAAANKLLAELDCPSLSLAEIRSFIGHGIAYLVDQMITAQELDPAQRNKLVARFKELYSQYPATLSKVYPGVSSLLLELSQQGYKLGVCTNKDEAIARKVLNDLELSVFFDVIVGGDTLKERKPDPAPLDHAFDCLAVPSGLFIGDSEVDALTACAAGVPFGLFKDGYRKAAVSDITHHFAFDTYEDFFNHFHSGIIASVFGP